MPVALGGQLTRGGINLILRVEDTGKRTWPCHPSARAHAVAERVGGVEDQRGVGGDVGAAANRGDQRVAAAAGRAFEDPAEDALLPPRLALGELAVCVEAGELGAGAGAAGGA